MKRTFAQASLWTLAFIFTASLCQADLAPPPPGGRPRPRPRPRPEAPQQADKSVPIVMQVDANATTAKLQIPQKLLPKMQVSQNAAPGSSRTIIAGIALSAAIAGVVLLRGRSRRVRTAAVGALLAAGLFGAVQIVSADIPLRPRPGDGEAGGEATGPRVLIEIVKAGDSITLAIPPGMIPQQVGAAPLAPPATSAEPQ